MTAECFQWVMAALLVVMIIALMANALVKEIYGAKD